MGSERADAPPMVWQVQVGGGGHYMVPRVHVSVCLCVRKRSPLVRARVPQVRRFWGVALYIAASWQANFGESVQTRSMEDILYVYISPEMSRTIDNCPGVANARSRMIFRVFACRCAPNRKHCIRHAVRIVG